MKRRFGVNNSFFGKKHSQESKQKMSESLKGRIPWNKGKKMSLEARKKMSIATRGRVVNKIREEGHWNWKGGKSHRTRKSYEWRRMVFERDNYTCQKCGERANIIAHHIKSYYKFENLRYKITNGITLCRSCHPKEHNGLKGN
jgi:hypothetical protein